MKPTEAEIIAALEAAKRSLDDARSMSCTDEMPTLLKDAKRVDEILKRLRGF